MVFYTRHFNKNWFVATIAGILLLLQSCESPDVTKDELEQRRPAYVYEVKSKTDQRMHSFVGKVDAKQRVDLSFEVAGRLTQLPLRPGVFVQAGTLIAELSSKPFALALEAASAQQALAQSDLRRKRELLREGAVSSALVDDAVQMLRLRDAQLAQANKALSDTRLYAPFDAHLAHRYLDNHMMVQPGQPIVRLHDLGELFIRISVPEKLFAALNQAGIDLFATFDVTGDQQFPLRLQEYEGEAGDIAQTYAVTLAMPPVPGIQLLPGMNTTVIAQRRDLVPSLWVPSEALVSDPEGNFLVWVVTEGDGLVTSRRVQIGTADDEGVRIESGVSEGETIVTAGAQQLRPGMRIRPIIEAPL
jgi:RND family efflux transporter MFP subunit